MLKEIIINDFGYNFDRKPYIKVADLRNMLIKEEGLTEKLKSPPTTPQKKKKHEKKQEEEHEIKIDYV